MQRAVEAIPLEFVKKCEALKFKTLERRLYLRAPLIEIRALGQERTPDLYSRHIGTSVATKEERLTCFNILMRLVDLCRLDRRNPDFASDSGAI